ncbi:MULTISPECIES: hypothetical protein [Paraburkholderia]|jgi:hypothetical protein|uniref:Uncharacterized protein n=1 Tax=Paraburkholderia madseniana TaxID=2599607 RepID=A0A6N6W684_9BURK|nr:MULTISPECIES: hypothetical protein [Paraburkholderia]KAE8755946.1 hypothetical protein FSO04_31700 [Paraburkholderia madseniana]MCX4177674.1 hypothetical protein [Paraburkholderia madseniana]MDQ6465663.1 hypothetical protein [Paraburkholderia madseniana]NPT68649.1 hypothetical protein [Paraburkholderia madseniana]
MKNLFALSLLLGALPAFAAAPKCQTQTIGQHTSKICITEVPFQHDYYTLSVDNAVILSAPDDYIENVSLTHTIPEDAGIEFPLSNQGTPIVTIQGGCVPVSEKQTTGSKTVRVEVARVCSFKWGNEQIVKDLRFSFE